MYLYILYIYRIRYICIIIFFIGASLHAKYRFSRAQRKCKLCIVCGSTSVAVCVCVCSRACVGVHLFAIVMNIAIIWLLCCHVSTFVFASKQFLDKCLRSQPVSVQSPMYVCVVVGVNLIFYSLLCNI